MLSCPAGTEEGIARTSGLSGLTAGAVFSNWGSISRAVGTDGVVPASVSADNPARDVLAGITVGNAECPDPPGSGAVTAEVRAAESGLSFGH